VVEQPELPVRHMPPAWLSSGELRVAAGLLLAVQSTSPPLPASTPSTQHVGRPAITTRPVVPLAPDAPAIVAPIFKHGEGLGRAGGVVGVPRGRLTEEEAFAVIRNELRRHGVELADRNITVGELTVRVGEYKTYYDSTAGTTLTRYEVSSAPLLVDGLDRRHQIAVEFVSVEDYRHLDGAWHGRCPSTAYWMETLAVARSVAEQTAGQRAGVRLGIFDDPLMTSPVELDYPAFCRSLSNAKPTEESSQKLDEWYAALRKGHEVDDREARELLRQQVRDFTIGSRRRERSDSRNVWSADPAYTVGPHRGPCELRASYASDTTSNHSLQHAVHVLLRPAA